MCMIYLHTSYNHNNNIHINISILLLYAYNHENPFHAFHLYSFRVTISAQMTIRPIMTDLFTIIQNMSTEIYSLPLSFFSL